jgi:hypothetical protein
MDMFDRSTKAREWLEHYLLTARDHRDLEQFVLIEGRAKGFSPKLLARVAADPRFELTNGWWGLTELRVEALEIRARLAEGPWRPAPPTPALPAVAVIKNVAAGETLSLRVSRRGR